MPNASAASGDRPASHDLRRLADLLRFLRPYRWQALGAGLALTVAASTVLGLGGLLRNLIDRGFGVGDAGTLDRALLLLFAATAVLALSSYVRFYLVTAIGERVVADIRKALFDHLITLSPGFFETARTGEVLSRLTTDTTLIQAVIGSSVSLALRNAIMMIGGLSLLALASPKLTLLIVVVVPLVVAPIVILGRQVRRLSRLAQDRIAAVSADAGEALYGIRVVQAFAHEAEDRRRFAALAESALAVALSRTRIRALLTAVVILLVFGAISVILWIGGADVLAGRMSAGQLSAFIFYAIVVAGSVGAISEVVGDLQRAAGAMERILDLLRTRPTIAAPASPVSLPATSPGRIQFDHVDFRYPAQGEARALTDFSLSVEPGETVALVGPSGAGKSTVFQLLMRFYDPQSGAIRLDGVDLRALDPAALRARMSLVAQEPVVFSLSAFENIRYGRPEAEESEVRAAAKAAFADEFLDLLPQGWHSPLGERGVRLSGGQRQRIAIARAILRNPHILLLDEATSALDSASERKVQLALEGLMRERTTLVIAHRLATVLQADRILVLDHGRIDAVGHHEELIAAGGLYARLAALQFARAPDADQTGNT